MDPEYLAIHERTFKNLEEVRASTLAVCLCCKRVIDTAAMFQDTPLDDICVACIDDGTMEETVFCPHCGIDAVIGDASGLPVTSPNFVDKLHAMAFRGRESER
jgi:hypothetical protein